MSFSKEKLESYLNLKKEFEGMASNVLLEKLKVDGEDNYKGEITEIEIYNETIGVTTTLESKCGCCPDDEYYYSFPISFLYSDWQEEYRLKVLEKQNKEQEKKLAEEEEKRKEQENEQYKLYIELKDKFEKV